MALRFHNLLTLTRKPYRPSGLDRSDPPRRQCADLPSLKPANDYPAVIA